MRFHDHEIRPPHKEKMSCRKVTNANLLSCIVYSRGVEKGSLIGNAMYSSTHPNGGTTGSNMQWSSGSISAPPPPISKSDLTNIGSCPGYNTSNGQRRNPCNTLEPTSTSSKPRLNNLHYSHPNSESTSPYF